MCFTWVASGLIREYYARLERLFCLIRTLINYVRKSFTTFGRGANVLITFFAIDDVAKSAISVHPRQYFHAN